jgi:hypothetical protein
MENQHKDSPTTVKEVGIHLGYLREELQEVKDEIKNFLAIASTKADVLILENKLKKLETRVLAIEEKENAIYRRISYIVIAGLVTMVLAWYGLDRFMGL